MDARFRQPPEVLFSDKYSRPVFQMGPYDNAAMTRNSVFAEQAASDVDWSRYFETQCHCMLTVNGREAISFALADLQLTRDDEVLIVTTSGSPYVSGCVTDAISRYCHWSRQPSPRTRAIFLIHEFGFPARLPAGMATAGLPIIEDCAYALGSQNAEQTVGTLGDYVVYSFSKAFPIPYGGLLKSPRPIALRSALSPLAQRQLPSLLAHYFYELPTSCRLRREFFEKYRVRFAAEGLAPLFTPEPTTVPHSFVVALPDQSKAEAMKLRLQEAGIISSVFYGGGGYFLPNHQSLSNAAIDYIAANFLSALSEV